MAMKRYLDEQRCGPAITSAGEKRYKVTQRRFTPIDMNLISTTPSPPCSQKTNTIVVAPLPKSFFHPLVLDAIRHHFATYGDINRWVPLTGFGRIIIVYTSEDDAERAKVECDPVVIAASEDRSAQCLHYSVSTLKMSPSREETILRVYRADLNPLIVDDSSVPEANYLKPPALEKNFLISPPGSPPVGWEPIREDPPNPTPLADDLIAALRKLQQHTKRSSLEVLLEPHEAGVGVYVQDCGEEDDVYMEEQDWAYGEPSPARVRWKPAATALPPMLDLISV